MATSNHEAGPLFSDAYSGTLGLVGYVLLAAVLMVADYRGHVLPRFRQQVLSWLDPVYEAAQVPAQVWSALRQGLAERSRLSGENTALREQLLFAQARLAQLAAMQEQNQRLRVLLDARTTLGLNAQLGELMDVDLDPYRHQVLIALGQRDGVREGQAVMDAQGVLGQVVSVREQQSVVTLITDPSHAIPVQVLRTGLRTIAYGNGSTQALRLPHIPFSAGVRVGDQLITSGMGGNFPAGLPVGTLTETEPDESVAFVLALAKPAADLTHHGEVLVVHGTRQRLRQPGSNEPGFEWVGPPELLRTPATKPAGAP